MNSLFQGMFEFSYSDLKDYQTCPYRFALNFRLRKEGARFRARNSRKFLEGWCIHKCLELWNVQGHWQPGWMTNVVLDIIYTRAGNAKFLSIGQDPVKANLPQFVLKEFLRKNNVLWRLGETEESVLSNIKRGLEQLEYWVVTLEMNHGYMQSERWFKLRIPQLNIISKGSIDLVDTRYPDIYDMKYSNAGYTDWRQLLWYDFMLTHILHRKIQKVYTFNPLNSVPLEYQENSEDELMGFFEELEGIIAEIRAGEFVPTPSKGECSLCCVAKTCEHCLFKD